MSTDDDTPDWPSLYDPSLELLHIPHKDPVQPRGHYLTHAQDVFSFTLYWTLIFYLPLFVFAGIFAFLNIIFPPNSNYRRQINDRPSESRYLDDNDSSARHEEAEDSTEMYPLSPFTTASIVSAPSPTTAVASTGYYPASPSSARGSRTPYTALVPKSGSSSAAPGPQTSISTTPSPAQRPSISASVPTSVAAASAAYRAAAKTQSRKQVNPHRTRVVYALLVLFVFLVSGLLGAVVGSAVVGYVLAGLYQAGGFHMSTWIPPLFALVQTLIGVLGIYPSVAEII